MTAPQATGATGALDVDALLTIDVDAEVRKLTQGRLQGDWQLPAELVREAIRSGATEIFVELRRRKFEIRSDAPLLSPSLLEHLTALRDPQAPRALRHAALHAIESGRGSTWLALVGLDTDFEITQDAKVMRVQHPMDAKKARQWLLAVSRFSPVPITLDQELLPRGFRGEFAVEVLETPLIGQLALPSEGEGGRIWLVEHGIVRTHLSIPNGPAFEAAIDVSASMVEGPAAQREAFAGQEMLLVEQAISGWIRLGERASTLPARVRSRVVRELLMAARHGRRLAEIARLPIFLGIEADGQPRWLELLALRQAVGSPGGPRILMALGPDQDPTHYHRLGRTFVLEDSERAILGELLSVAFVTPPRIVSAAWAQRVWRRWVDALHGAATALLWRIRRPSRKIPDHELSPRELALLTILREASPGLEVAVLEGDGRIRHVGSKLSLPREHVQVRSGARASDLGPAWHYPIALALLGEREQLRAPPGWRFSAPAKVPHP